MWGPIRISVLRLSPWLQSLGFRRRLGPGLDPQRRVVRVALGFKATIQGGVAGWECVPGQRPWQLTHPVPHPQPGQLHA